MISGLVSRSPRGGGHGGGGHSSGGDSGGSSSSGGGSHGGSHKGGSDDCSADCPSGQKSCGDYCIPSSANCCEKNDVLGVYCKASERCVESEHVENFYKCCPASDSSCNGDSISSTQTTFGDYHGMCESGGMVYLARGAVALGVAGAAAAWGL